MIQNLLSAALAIVFGLAGGVAGPSARAASSAAEVWQGQYVCGQGLTDLTLTMIAGPTGRVKALFEFYADPRNPGVPRGCFEMSGSQDDVGHVILAPGHWRLRPLGYVSVSITGDLSASAFTGHIDGPGCGAFVLERVVDLGATETGCGGAES